MRSGPPCLPTTKGEAPGCGAAGHAFCERERAALCAQIRSGAEDFRRRDLLPPRKKNPGSPRDGIFRGEGMAAMIEKRPAVFTNN